jgi:hypothetical protein
MLAGGTSPVRAQIIHGQGQTEVVFRRSDRWKSLLKLLIFAPVWLFGGMFAAVLMAATSDGSPMLIIWLVLWGLGGLVFLYLLLWGVLGIESLVARAETLTLKRRLLLFVRSIPLPSAELTEIRWLADDPARSVRVNGRRIPQTAIQISADGRNWRCAQGISEAEALPAIADLKQRLVVSWRRR